MNRFTIKDIEKLTGIKSHTLRIWEQRYGIPQPRRTATNIRYYSDEDLKFLLNISLLNRQGYKISKLSGLSKEELEKLAHTRILEDEDPDTRLQGLLTVMINLDEAAFEKLLSGYLLKFGMERTMLELFFPFLKHIGMLWQTGQVNPAFEHFMSSLIRQKIIVAIDALPISSSPNAATFLLFLPETESHELGLLFANYLVRKYDHKSVYLGQNMPLDELDTVVKKIHIDYILTALTSSSGKTPVFDTVKNLSERYTKQRLLVTGSQVASDDRIKSTGNIRVLADFGDLIRILQNN